ncbi:aminopeptidase N [Demequina aurantiaca]|uniref:aminopeptidase N n=1 Tax=Demequina aurantiaca TaxID=676200 RepID=UPI000785CF31|nr:aminopeptidase N [Demequina aurantiaca]
MATTLTKDEAQTRAQTVSHATYALDFDFTGAGDSPTFRSRTTLRFDATEGVHTFVELVSPYVHSIVLNGEPLDILSVHRDDRIMLTDLREHNVLEVDAECRYSTSGQGIHRFIDPEDGQVYLYSQFAIDDARRAFAAFDQPDIKGTFTTTVLAPDHWQVLSNTVAPTPVSAEGSAPIAGQDHGVQRWEFAASVPIPCYVAGIHAGPYVFEETTLQSKKGPIPARLYGRPQLREHFAADDVFADTQRGFTLYEDIFETEYPYDSYDQIYVPEYNWGAMENVGCVTISEDKYLFRTRVSDADHEARSNVVLHELAHMWFGNLVTMRWWDDLWLNESFAEFVSTYACVETTEWIDAWVGFGASRKSVAYVQDQRPTTHPVLGDVATVEAVAGTFDMITYAKGASALKQLALTLGYPTFFTGVAAYIRANAFGNATLGDLFTELEAASGRDLGPWATAWLETPGVTTLSAELVTSDTLDDAGTEVITRLAVREETPADYPSQRPHQLEVGGYSWRGIEFMPVFRIQVETSGAVTDVPEVVGQPRPDLVVVNDRDLTYAKMHLDEASLATVADQVGDIDDPMLQSVVLDSLWHMCRDGALPATKYIDAVVTALPVVEHSQVRASHCANLIVALRLYAPPATTVALAQATAAQVWTVLQEAEGGSDLQLQALELFAAIAASATQADSLQALLNGTTQLDGLPIDSDLAWSLVSGLARAGREGDAEIDARLAVDNSAADARRGAGARASIGTLDAKRRAWARLSAPKGAPLPNSQAYEVALGISRVNDPAMLVPMATEILGSLRPTYESLDSFMAMRVVTYAFPHWAAGRVPGFVEMLDQWLADNSDAASVLIKIVTEGRYEALRAEAAQQA